VVLSGTQAGPLQGHVVLAEHSFLLLQARVLHDCVLGDVLNLHFLVWNFTTWQLLPS
jgi:hypothetical protein